MRVIFHVRCHGEPDEELEESIMQSMANIVNYPARNWGILTIGRSYYHETNLCTGHPNPREDCLP